MSLIHPPPVVNSMYPLQNSTRNVAWPCRLLICELRLVIWPNVESSELLSGCLQLRAIKCVEVIETDAGAHMLSDTLKRLDGIEALQAQGRRAQRAHTRAPRSQVPRDPCWRNALVVNWTGCALVFPVKKSFDGCSCKS